MTVKHTNVLEAFFREGPKMFPLYDNALRVSTTRGQPLNMGFSWLISYRGTSQSPLSYHFNFNSLHHLSDEKIPWPWPFFGQPSCAHIIIVRFVNKYLRRIISSSASMGAPGRTALGAFMNNSIIGPLSLGSVDLFRLQVFLVNKYCLLFSLDEIER